MAVQTVTLAEYLSNPAYRYSEWVDGKPVKLNIRTGTHARLQAECGFHLGSYMHRNRVGDAYMGVHCRLEVLVNPQPGEVVAFRHA